MNAIKKRRVVITGMGAVTPVGNSMQDTWNGVIEGKVVADKVKKFDASEFPTKFAYEVSDFELDKSLIDDKDLSFLNLAGEYGVNAATEAVKQAGIDTAKIDSDRLSICVGVGMFSPSFDWYSEVMLEEKWQDPSLKKHIQYWPNPFSEVLAKMIGAQGGVTTIHTACASSGQSLGEAFEQIAYGDADVVLTGGTDSMINRWFQPGLIDTRDIIYFLSVITLCLSLNTLILNSRKAN